MLRLKLMEVLLQECVVLKAGFPAGARTTARLLLLLSELRTRPCRSSCLFTERSRPRCPGFCVHERVPEGNSSTSFSLLSKITR